VVTGPVLRKELLKIGPNGVSVPEFYYKVVADLECVPARGIAFLLPNESCPKMVKDYAVTIDSVEKVTGIDFFSALNKYTEKQVEAVFVDTLWMTNKKATEPIDLKNLPPNALNTTMLAHYENLQVMVCGTVLNVKEDLKKNVIYLDIDDKHPNQPFSVEVNPNPDNGLTFESLKALKNKKQCFRGVLLFDGKKHVMKIDTKASFFELQTE
jgi:endonuclease G